MLNQHKMLLTKGGIIDVNVFIFGFKNMYRIDPQQLVSQQLVSLAMMVVKNRCTQNLIEKYFVHIMKRQLKLHPMEKICSYKR